MDILCLSISLSLYLPLSPFDRAGVHISPSWGERGWIDTHNQSTNTNTNTNTNSILVTFNVPHSGIHWDACFDLF